MRRMSFRTQLAGFLLIALAAVAAPEAVAQTYNPTVTPSVLTVTAGGAAASFQASVNPSGGYNSGVQIIPVLPSQLEGHVTITPVSQFSDVPYPPVTFQVQAAASAPVGNHFIFVEFSSTQNKSVVLQLNIVAGAAPDFNLSASPNPITIPAGSSRGTSIDVVPVNGFTGTVNVTGSLLSGPSPGGITFPTSFTVTEPGPPFTANVGTTSSTPVGTYVIRYVGTSGSISAHVDVTVNVVGAQSYTLTATPPAVTVTQGGAAATTTIAAVPSGGFTGVIYLSITTPTGEPLPAGLNVALNTMSFSVPGAPATATISASNTLPAGTYIVRIAGVTSFGERSHVDIPVTVLPSGPAPDFAITATPQSTTVMRGGSVAVTVTATFLNGFNSPVTVTASAPGATASPQTFTLTPSAPTQTVTVTTTGGTALGPLAINFTATSGALTRTASTTVTVTPAATGAPVVDAITPPASTIPSRSVTLRITGQNFAPGAIALISIPGVVVEQTRYLTANALDVVVTVRPNTPRGGYFVRVQNPDGGISNEALLELRSRDEIGAPLGVTTAEIVFPPQGSIIASRDAVVPRARFATSGTGAIVVHWLLDGVRFDSVTAQVHAGMPTYVGSNRAIPASPWGDHRLEIEVENPQLDVRPGITISFQSDSGTALTIYEPTERVNVNGLTRFRWTMLPAVTGYEIEFVEENRTRLPVIFRTSRSSWTPTADDLQKLQAGTFRWRVRGIYPNEVPGQPTPWLTVIVPTRSARNNRAVASVASAAPLTSVAATIQESPAVPDPGAPVTPSVNTNYTATPMVTVNAAREGDPTASAQLTTQGDLAAAATNTKFTGDLNYGVTFDPDHIGQQSRNWILEAGRTAGTFGGDLRYGYTTPDFTDAAEFLTSGSARTGVIGRFRSPFGTLSYYEPVNNDLYGLLSANPENLDIQSAAFATPDGRRYQVRVIGLQVGEPANELFFTPGSRTRTFGIFGKYDLSPRMAIVAEAAHGELEPDLRSIESREGEAFRVGLTGTLAGMSYGLNVRSVGANFVNPANRGLTPGGVADRVSADLNLSRTFGRASVNFAVQRSEQGRSSESTLPDAGSTSANISLSTMLGRVSLNIGANTTADRGDADVSAFLSETRRDMHGVNLSLSETFGRFSLSQNLSFQQTDDDINPLSDQEVGMITLSANGMLITNVTLSASLTGTRTEAAPTVGTTDNLSLSLTPSIALPFASLSFQPGISFNRSDNDLFDSQTDSDQLQTMLQWSPQGLGSLVAAQVSASWNHNETSGLFESDTRNRSYQGSVTLRMNKNKGVPLFPRSNVPGTVAFPPPEQTNPDVPETHEITEAAEQPAEPTPESGDGGNS